MVGWRSTDFPLNNKRRCGSVRNARSAVSVAPVCQCPSLSEAQSYGTAEDTTRSNQRTEVITHAFVALSQPVMIGAYYYPNLIHQIRAVVSLHKSPYTLATATG